MEKLAYSIGVQRALEALGLSKEAQGGRMPGGHVMPQGPGGVDSPGWQGPISSVTGGGKGLTAMGGTGTRNPTATTPQGLLSQGGRNIPTQHQQEWRPGQNLKQMMTGRKPTMMSPDNDPSAMY